MKTRKTFVLWLILFGMFIIMYPQYANSATRHHRSGRNHTEPIINYGYVNMVDGNACVLAPPHYFNLTSCMIKWTDHARGQTIVGLSRCRYLLVKYSPEDSPAFYDCLEDFNGFLSKEFEGVIDRRTISRISRRSQDIPTEEVAADSAAISKLSLYDGKRMNILVKKFGFELVFINVQPKNSESLIRTVTDSFKVIAD